MFTILAFVIGAVLEDGVQKIVSDKSEDRYIGLFWLLCALIFAALWGVLQYWYRNTLESDKNVRQAQERVITDVRERIAMLSVEQLERCEMVVEGNAISIDDLRSILICEANRIKDLINAVWEVINSHYNEGGNAIERINFELTLITPSLNDTELTIASFRNRENHSPKSLLIRNRCDSTIYRRTEAAKMIKSRLRTR
ncbi:MAG: hypothetical protein IPJ30_15235 [Acidobacteria bacterium]|nr:hypothetical protein [Acidobacteriota bacterium]